MRTQYETAEDLKREGNFLSRIQAELGWTILKVPKSYHVEAILFSGEKVVGFLEVKVRKAASTDFETLFISLLKVNAGISIARTLAVPFYVAIQWKDKWGLLNVSDSAMGSMKVEFGGRTFQTRDAADIEPVVHFPIKSFTMFELLKEKI